MSKIKKDFLDIQGWMVEELGLSGKELMTYAIVYRFSFRSENGCFTKLEYFKKWLGVSSDTTVIKVLNSLLEKGLITKHERPGCTNVYRVNEDLIDDEEGSKNWKGGSKNWKGRVPKNETPKIAISDGTLSKIETNIYNRLDITENKRAVNLDDSFSSSVSTQDAESTASDRELSAPSPFEAPNTKRTDEVNEQDTTQQPSTGSKVPRNQSSVIYNTLRSRLGRAARNHHLPQDVRDRASKQLLMLKNSATNRRIKENLQNMIELSDADIVKQAVLDSLNAVYTDKDGSPQNTNVVRLLSMEDYQMALSIMQGNIKDPTALIEKIGDDIEEE